MMIVSVRAAVKSPIFCPPSASTPVTVTSSPGFTVSLRKPCAPDHACPSQESVFLRASDGMHHQNSGRSLCEYYGRDTPPDGDRRAGVERHGGQYRRSVPGEFVGLHEANEAISVCAACKRSDRQGQQEAGPHAAESFAEHIADAPQHGADSQDREDTHRWRTNLGRRHGRRARLSPQKLRRDRLILCSPRSARTEQREELQDWVGDDYDPNALSVDGIDHTSNAGGLTLHSW